MGQLFTFALGARWYIYIPTTERGKAVISIRIRVFEDVCRLCMIHALSHHFPLARLEGKGSALPHLAR